MYSTELEFLLFKLSIVTFVGLLQMIILSFCGLFILDNIYRYYKYIRMSSVSLRTGSQMPLLGLGTWKIPKQQAASVVYESIKAGYRLIDCACDYGNEKEVGEGIKKAIQQGIVERSQLFVTSKLWNTFHRPEHVPIGFEKTLKDLDVGYLDLYLMHFPIALKYVDPSTRYPPEWIHDPTAPQPVMVEDQVPLAETWRAMEKLVEQGLVKNIGVSNFNIALLRDLINSSKTVPAVLQVELHPFLTQKKLIKYCELNNIRITAYSSFGGSSYVELGSASNEDILMEHNVIKSIAEKHKKSPAQVLLKWAVQQNLAVIPKTLKPERLPQNADIFQWTLTPEQMQELDNLNRNKRYNDPGVYCEKFFGLFFPIYE